MMKSGSILLVVLALFVLLTSTFGSRIPIADITFCPRHLDLSGKCSNSRNCGEDLNAALGASAMVHGCSCQDLSSNQHRCTCLAVCQ
ncbi:unnamed protein product [Lathyrus oleraceus]